MHGALDTERVKGSIPSMLRKKSLSIEEIGWGTGCDNA
jgi:hypothetical protein